MVISFQFMADGDTIRIKLNIGDLRNGARSIPESGFVVLCLKTLNCFCTLVFIKIL